MYLNTRNKNECCGCRACAEICPQQCIAMREDENGFVYPYVEFEQCVNCRLCERVCPMCFDGFVHQQNAEAWVGMHKSPDICLNSSSGGAFSAISNLAMERGFCVYGVAFDPDFQVKHMRATEAEECRAFRKSKYILSNTNGCLSKVALDLKNGGNVFFTGAPCQCAALYNFLKAKNISTNNLLTADVICHGAPSQRLFDCYRKEIEQRSKCGKLSLYTFRNKEPLDGVINSRSAAMEFFSGHKRIVDRSSDPFLLGYYSRLFYRDSCAKCPFAKPERVTDITLGDAWGINQIFPELRPLQGVSLILANTPKGKRWINDIQPIMALQSVSVDWAVSANEQLRCPTKMHPNRSLFLTLWKKKGFAYAVNKAIRGSYLERLFRKLRTIIR